jgi:hypothetical protein
MTAPHTYDLIKYGKYAAAIISLSVVLLAIYETNAWAGDIDKVEASQKQSILEMEKRMLTRSIMQWATRPAANKSDQQYKELMVDQLKSDKEDVIIKLRAMY